MRTLSEIKNNKNQQGTPSMNVLRLASNVSDTQTITIGDQVYEINTTGGVTAGRVAVTMTSATAVAALGTLTLTSNLSPGVKATGTLTLSANAANTETVVIGGKTYTFQDSLTNSDGNVKVGADAAGSISNLVAAITLGAGSGTAYAAAMTLHSTVTAAVGGGGGTQATITAKAYGTAGNSIGTTETLGSGAFGAATLSGGVQPDTVTIGSRTYTFQDALTNVAGNVLIDAGGAAGTISNLVAAINAGAGSGSVYAAATTAHPDVTGSAGAGTTVIATAKVAGVAGNSITTTETSNNASWGAATLAGGIDEDSPIEASTAIVTAINNNANSKVTATKISDNEVLIVHDDIGINALSCTETLAGSNNAWASSTMFGGSNAPASIKNVVVISRTVTAVEEALDTVHFVLPFAISTFLIQLRNSSGIIKAFDGTAVVSGNRLTLTSSGSTDCDQNDVVTVIASS